MQTIHQNHFWCGLDILLNFTGGEVRILADEVPSIFQSAELDFDF